jgi:hypothetical protein
MALFWRSIAPLFSPYEPTPDSLIYVERVQRAMLVYAPG